MTINGLREISSEETSRLNQYSLDFLNNLRTSSGVNNELWEEAIDDMLTVSDLNISSDEDYKVFFYIDNFAETIAEEILGTGISDAEQAELKKFMFTHREEFPLNSLVGFRVSMLKWIESMRPNKTASRYSRTSPAPVRALNIYDIEKWVGLVNDINFAKSRGIDTKAAVIEASRKIEANVERLDFLAWYQFKFGNMKDLYNMNKIIKEKSQGSLHMKKADVLKVAGVYEDAASYYLPKEIFKQDRNLEKPKQELAPEPAGPDPEELVRENLSKQEDEAQLEMARSKMIARTFALDKLLEKFRHLLNKEQLSQIEDSINALRKQLRQIKKASVANDIMLRTARILDKKGFEDGGLVLRKIASQNLIKDADQVTTLSPKTSEDELHVLDVLINKLTEISTFLKQRSLVRDLSEADLMLYDLNIASLFPELTEAQSRLIDAFTYAGNKIDDILPKIRGSAENLRSEESAPTENLPDEHAADEILVNLPDQEDLDVAQTLPNAEPPVTEPVSAPPLSTKRTTVPDNTLPQVQELERAIQEG